MRKRWLVLLLLGCAGGHADIDRRPIEEPFHYEKPISEGKKLEYPEKYVPWLTGPLLAPTSYVISGGHYSIEPYVFATDFFGTYDAHWKTISTPHFISINPELYAIIGLSERLDFQITPEMFYNYTEGVSSTEFGDLITGIDIQLLTQIDGSWHPTIKLSLLETFPTGKYQKLKGWKKGTDGVGTGSFISGLLLSSSRIFHIKKHHFFIARLSANYNLSSSVDVKGFNSYGGGKSTRGRVYPGNSFVGIFSFEYTFNQRWVLAMDSEYTHVNKTRFSGRRGENPVKQPSSEQFDLAPALEYNWSPSMGLIAGAWFSIAGRNIPQFAGGVVAFNYYH